MGGEEKASVAPILFDGARGSGNLLEKLFPEIEVLTTIVSGDNYVAENSDRAVQEILDMLTPLFEGSKTEKSVLLLAGPAFNAGLMDWLVVPPAKLLQSVTGSRCLLAPCLPKIRLLPSTGKTFILPGLEKTSHPWKSLCGGWGHWG